MRYLFIFFLISLVTSCSTITRSDCKKDMYAFGLDHGKNGLNKFTEDIQNTCITKESTVDLEGYERGFNAGWSQYCTPFNGFRLGARGELYKSYCPLEKEELFKEKFLVGKRVFDKKDQLLELGDKMKSLSSRSPLTQSDQNEMQYLKKEWDLLYQEIEKLEQIGRSSLQHEWK